MNIANKFNANNVINRERKLLIDVLNIQISIAAAVLGSTNLNLVHELINNKCGRSWHKSLSGVAQALEYIVAINSDNGY